MAESAAVEFRIDRRSGVATYLQIVQQTKQALRLGVLEPGDRLPTAREVVEATAINPNTVLKAYRELEREGLVEARRGLGTFVRRTLGGAAGASASDSPLRTELADWARRARSAGLEKDDVSALFTAVLDSTYQPDSTCRPDSRHKPDSTYQPDSRHA
ncbi:GntR family transcriptional regulator [Streptomyces cyaneofuscatus]|uniref:GntR family transcriptional regulator n=1 Tax=Streptomyces cyaneofuscatus TaxID=66883 RepID=UPI0036DA25F4